MKKGKRLIGKTDKADIPEWGLENIPVKIDSGAYRSTIDCSQVKVVKRNKERVLQFVLLHNERPLHSGDVFESRNFRTSKVKSSNGEVEKRFVIRTQIILFGKPFETEFTLSKRDDMKFPILIGRKLLNGNFIIDTSKSNLSWRWKKRKNKKIS